MGKFESLTKAVLSIFETAEWKIEGLKTYPSNFVTVSSGNTFLRVDVIPGGAGINLKSTSGQVMIDIFTPAGSGPLTALRIADKLDAYLVGKSKIVDNCNVQLGNSSFNNRGIDKSNSALSHSVYVIPFNYFGVL
jgi:hypothetical protein